jgi:hypothetical protein
LETLLNKFNIQYHKLQKGGGSETEFEILISRLVDEYNSKIEETGIAFYYPVEAMFKSISDFTNKWRKINTLTLSTCDETHIDVPDVDIGIEIETIKYNNV